MKRILYILCAAAALLSGLWSCRQEKDDTVIDQVELRYRVEDRYDLPATGAKPFNIQVVSSHPWVIESEHPTWCMISEEDGTASDAQTVHEGKAEPTLVRVQYYDNTLLDDRVDHLRIYCPDGGVSKKVTVTQKGNAFLIVPEEELEWSVERAGGDLSIHIDSNQPWSSRILSGDDWLGFEGVSSGEGESVLVFKAEPNSAEERYAEAAVYDRNQVKCATLLFTQDGVRLIPEALELRAGFDQLSAELSVSSNTKWTVTKASESDTWFTIETPTGENDGKIILSLTKNTGEDLNKAEIYLRNVVESEGDYQAEKVIVVKQGYEIVPQRVMLNSSELGDWSSDWANKPVYVDGQGVKFTAKSRVSRSMPFGNYTFRWSNYEGDATLENPLRIRHWFCFDEELEIKADIRPYENKVSFSFNKAKDGNTPSFNSFTDADFTQPVEFTIKFDPSGAEHCHVTILVNGKEAGSFDSAPDFMRTVTWNTGFRIYIGADNEGSGSAICEWYEYTAPMNWD